MDNRTYPDPASNTPLDPQPSYSQSFKRAAAVVAGACLLVAVVRLSRDPQSILSSLTSLPTYKRPFGVCTVVPPIDPALVLVYSKGTLVDAGIADCDPYYATPTRPLYAEQDQPGQETGRQRLAMGVKDKCTGRTLKIPKDSDVTVAIPVACNQLPPVGTLEPNWPYPGGP